MAVRTRDLLRQGCDAKGVAIIRYIETQGREKREAEDFTIVEE